MKKIMDTQLITCHSLREYYETRRRLLEKGYIEIKSNIQPLDGENLIKFDGYFFALTINN